MKRDVGMGLVIDTKDSWGCTGLWDLMMGRGVDGIGRHNFMIRAHRHIWSSAVW